MTAMIKVSTIVSVIVLAHIGGSVYLRGELTFPLEAYTVC